MQKNDDKYRVTTMITAKEKEWLQHLAWKSGRSMSGYIRHFVNEDIERNSDQRISPGQLEGADCALLRTPPIDGHEKEVTE